MDIHVDIQIDPALGVEVEETVLGANLAAAVTATLHDRGVIQGTVTVAVLTDEEVQSLNHDYRGIDSPTDVLSFAAQEEGEGDLLASADLPRRPAGRVGGPLGRSGHRLPLHAAPGRPLRQLPSPRNCASWSSTAPSTSSATTTPPQKKRPRCGPFRIGSWWGWGIRDWGFGRGTEEGKRQSAKGKRQKGVG